MDLNNAVRLLILAGHASMVRATLDARRVHACMGYRPQFRRLLTSKHSIDRVRAACLADRALDARLVRELNAASMLVTPLAWSPVGRDYLC